jgi:uncharacterized protein YdcH (DUF465 family)
MVLIGCDFHPRGTHQKIPTLADARMGRTKNQYSRRVRFVTKGMAIDHEIRRGPPRVRTREFFVKSSWRGFCIVIGCFYDVTPHSQFGLVRRRAMPTLSREIREQLLTYDEEFQKLVQKHSQYEAELKQLSQESYLNQEDLQQQITLKKLKLSVKDAMERHIAERLRASPGR